MLNIFLQSLLEHILEKDRKPFKSIALTTDTSFMTAWSNDFEFASVFSRQIKALSSNIGLSIGMSTSGKSENIIKV